MRNLVIVSLFLLFLNCNQQAQSPAATSKKETAAPVSPAAFDTSIKTIHVLVALCDNKYQGIVPVPAKIGNGQDPDNNLYWGCAFGVRSYFKKSGNWKFLKSYRIDSTRLERLIFRHNTSGYYLVADAYNGKEIRQCTVDFLRSCSGKLKDAVQVANQSIGINGNARLLAYIGHDGLMDFSLSEQFTNTDNKERDAIMLACISKQYFAPHIAATKARPLVWSTGLMSPEAYTLHDALESYIKKEPAGSIRTSAAKAYARYQKCSERAAMNLLVSGK